jgi:hypothetical protein
MRYVILRDDDTNALTPVDCLERLYRPFLDRGLPVNLATIPDVDLDARKSDGSPEGFLPRNGPPPARSRNTVQLRENKSLVKYLLGNPGFHIIQHGLHHEFHEFDRIPSNEVGPRLDEGTRLLMEAGFPRPQTFVAPYDRLSRSSFTEVAKRFQIISTGWYELGRIPLEWWPNYFWKKLRHAPHWRVEKTLLLSHPGCLLSCFRDCDSSLRTMLAHIQRQQVTVLVTHWWEYFRNGVPDETFIRFLHETAHYLANHPDLKVISFSELVSGRIRLN